MKADSCRCPKAAKVQCSSVQNLSKVPVQTTIHLPKRHPRGEKRGEGRRGRGRGEKQQMAEEATTSRSSGNEVVEWDPS